MEEFAINGRRIGSAHRPYLIAEMSANHGGDIERARRIIRLAADNGADAIKLQAYTADDLTIDNDGPDFQLKSGLWAVQTLYQLYRSASTPYHWLGTLFEEADKAGIAAFATPFSTAAVDHLTKLGAPAYKIASFEAIDLELIRAAARTGKPVIISTGLCDADDMTRALEAARSAGARDIALLKCTSAYPAEPDAQNLLTIPDMAARFDVPIGFSDHTLGNAAAISAVALGAVAVEKHFIDAHDPPTADSTFSCVPEGLRALRCELAAAW
jgi:sialic acid synthase SpsE